MHKYGIEGELHPMGRYLVEKFGINEGLIIGYAVTVPMTIGLAYLMNRLGKNYENKLVKNMGSLCIYGVAAVGVPIVANNFISYSR